MQILKWKVPEAISIFFPAIKVEAQIRKHKHFLAPVMLSALSMK
jgi:5-hydroxyisourate hydrolase-like protein (transthyretin family)